MREITKSMLSYTWAVSMFSVQQMSNLLMPGDKRGGGKATSAFDQVTAATVSELGDTMRATFRAGDQLQRGIVDLMLGGVTAACNPERWMNMRREAPPSPQAGASAGGGTTATASSWSWGPPRSGGQASAQAHDCSATESAPGAESGRRDTGWGPMP